jgi:hypothetical protein
VGIQFSALCSALLANTTLACLPAVASAQPARSGVPVMLQNEANVPSEIVERAKGEVTRLFGLIDVDLTWVTDVPAPGTRLRTVSLTTWEPPEEKVQPSVLGYTQTAPEKRGVRGYVFWRRVERASLAFTARLHHVLAVAIAHELGHMLLPDGKHAKGGLMAGPWDAGHFRAASAGLLAFSSNSATLIRREIAKERASIAAANPPAKR